MMNEFSVAVVTWDDASDALGDIRRRVFMQEQGVPEELEWDGLDASATHLLASSIGGEAIGCARLLCRDHNGISSGHIGRMAVLPAWRRRGVGTRLLQATLAQCRQHELRKLHLNAQVQVTDFYRQAGFAIVGDQFNDAGIAHLRMELALPTHHDGLNSPSG